MLHPRRGNFAEEFINRAFALAHEIDQGSFGCNGRNAKAAPYVRTHELLLKVGRFMRKASLPPLDNSVDVITRLTVPYSLLYQDPQRFHLMEGVAFHCRKGYFQEFRWAYDAREDAILDAALGTTQEDLDVGECAYFGVAFQNTGRMKRLMLRHQPVLAWEHASRCPIRNGQISREHWLLPLQR